MGKKSSSNSGSASGATTANAKNDNALFVGSIDQGTTSTRFLLFDQHGNIRGSHQLEHKQIMPSMGLVEHDPIEIWKNTVECIVKCLKNSHVQASQIKALGITNQRETTIVWNKTTGKPYYNALVWQDTRNAELCDELIDLLGKGKDALRTKTGLPIVTYFSGTKLQWLLRNVPGLKEDAEKGEALFGTIDCWLLWNLSNGKHHITDCTNASRSLLMDIQTLQWDPEICKILGIPMKMLPEIRSSSEVYFTCMGIPELYDVPVSGVLGDQQAALVGQSCFSVGEAKNTYGTGCFMLLNTGEKSVQSKCGLLTTVAYKLGRNAPTIYALEGSVAIAGALVQWLRDNLQIISSAPEVETLAKTVPDNGGVYFVPAFSGLFAPHWREDARGVIVGMSRFNTKAHIARASLEATAYQSRDVFHVMAKDSGVSLKALKVDGGMVQNELLMQFQADVLNCPVIRPVVAETTALGAAFAAGLAVKFFKSIEELQLLWKEDKRFSPSMTETKRDQLFHEWDKAVSRTLNWVEPHHHHKETTSLKKTSLLLLAATVVMITAAVTFKKIQ